MMYLFRLLNLNKFDYKLLVFVILSGLLNTGIIVSAHQNILNYHRIYFVLFIVFFCSYIACFVYIFRKMSDIFRISIYQSHLRLTRKIRRLSLIDLENIGELEISDILTTHITNIAQSNIAFITFITSLFMGIFVYFYIALQSLIAFVTLMIVLVITLMRFSELKKELNASQDNSTQVSQSNLKMLSHLLDGFREIKMNQARNDAIVDEIQIFSEQAKDINIATNELFYSSEIFVRYIIFLGMASILFILPRIIQISSSVMLEVVGLFLFSTKSIVILIATWPLLERANNSAKFIMQFEQRIDKSLSDELSYQPIVPYTKFDDFDYISLENLTFKYNSENSFSVGPFCFKIYANEILYIIGDNGSGKTTLIKLITALYPYKGILKVGSEIVTPQNCQNYREMFSIILSDFHLFRKLYGLYNVEIETIEKSLKQMDLETKTIISKKSFSNTKLSSGQKKRLALLLSILEDKPIYVFDEWAAEQDFHFRNYFYEYIIPDLKILGKTIIIVTHDDRYFHFADRIIKLSKGKVLERNV